MNRAREAGAIVHDGSTDMFWSIYEPASEAWGMTFPEPLLRRLVAVGAARIHAVRTDERPVSVLLTLVGRSHWMCWLAAQTAEGRRMAASYLAYDALFAEAKAAGVPYVNLGASVGDGAEFKHHLGAVEMPMFEWSRATVSGAAGQRFVRALASVRQSVGTWSK